MISFVIKVCMISLVAISSVFGWEYRAIAYNIERGYKSDATVEKIQQNISEIGYAHLWAFSEVSIGDSDKLTQALNGTVSGSNFAFRLGNVGSDYLALAFDLNYFQELDSIEVKLAQPKKYRRKPLALKLKEINSGAAFWVVSNHLYRGKGDHPDRAQEAEDLRDWVAIQTIPVVAMGDFNLDYSIRRKKFKSRAAAALMKGHILNWVVPKELVQTHCSHHNFVADFIFVTATFDLWNPRSRILKIPDPCIDDKNGPDHRPVELIFQIS